MTWNMGRGHGGSLEKTLTRRAENRQGVSLTACEDLLSECTLCGKGKRELAFELPVFDGPYANDIGHTLRSFFRCEQCGFISVEPFEAGRYLTYYSKLNESYHCQHDMLTSRYQAIAPMLDHAEIHRVLDWGCGTGEFLSTLPDSVAKYGIELSGAAIQVAQERGIEILCENDLDDGRFSCSFDLVIAIDVAEHIRDLPRWRRKIAGLLKPDGYFIFMTGNLDSWAARNLGRHWYYLHYAEHISFLTEIAARTWLAPEFEDVQIELVTHHEIGTMDLVKCVVKFCVAWTLQKLGTTSRVRISSSFPATRDHMLVRARRRSS